jgi:hypothetical protein
VRKACCFVAGTLVDTEVGLRPIESIKEGERVWAQDVATGEIALKAVLSAVTNLAALRGEAVTEASRWGVDGWELFAGSGPDTPQEELRVVPIATLVGSDQSLLKVLSLDVGKSLWRESGEDAWHDW